MIFVLVVMQLSFIALILLIVATLDRKRKQAETLLV